MLDHRQPDATIQANRSRQEEYEKRNDNGICLYAQGKAHPIGYGTGTSRPNRKGKGERRKSQMGIYLREQGDTGKKEEPGQKGNNAP